MCLESPLTSLCPSFSHEHGRVLYSLSNMHLSCENGPSPQQSTRETLPWNLLWTVQSCLTSARLELQSYWDYYSSLDELFQSERKFLSFWKSPFPEMNSSKTKRRGELKDHTDWESTCFMASVKWDHTSLCLKVWLDHILRLLDLRSGILNQVSLLSDVSANKGDGPMR